MAIRRRLIAGVLLVLAVSCSGGTIATSGVAGTVTIGPTCPELQDGDRCERVPFETTLLIRELKTGRKVITVQSGADGAFRVELPPGDYILEPASQGGFLPPYADSQQVTIHARQFTVIEMAYDSGIR